MQNATNPLDTNQDQLVSPVDALQVINFISSHRSGKAIDHQGPSALVDVNGDGWVTPLDALLVLNALHSPAEGESHVLAPAAEQVDLALGALPAEGDIESALDELIEIELLKKLQRPASFSLRAAATK